MLGLYGMGALGLRAFAGVTIGVMGGVLGIHWSLALSAGVLLAVVIGLLTLSARPAAAGGTECRLTSRADTPFAQRLTSRSAWSRADMPGDLGNPESERSTTPSGSCCVSTGGVPGRAARR